jgi:nucleoside-diphosphate-sugar epimerase
MFTILGASGFVGNHLVSELQARNIEYFAPTRSDATIFDRDLGRVIYCIGYTADFRQKPHETIEAHVCLLNEVLQRARFESLLYLSSTRIYARSKETNEDSRLLVDPADPGDLYNLSKLMGESACLATSNPLIRVVRLANLFGRGSSPEDFLASLVRNAIHDKHITLATSLDSAKDYLSVETAAKLLLDIATSGRHRLYNVASGVNVTNRAIVEMLHSMSGCVVEVQGSAETIIFPLIDIGRLRNEFPFEAETVLGSIPRLMAVNQ